MLRAEAKEFIGSNLETSDSEGFVPGGCRRITTKPYSRKIKRFPGPVFNSKGDGGDVLFDVRVGASTFIFGLNLPIS